MEAIAPLALADHAWDNVGVLIDCSRDSHDTSSNSSNNGNNSSSSSVVAAAPETVMLTIDLTERVLEESVRAGARVVVAYHPCIFAPLKRLTHETAIQRVVLAAVRAGVSVYCPHTALDAAVGGINDWLARCVAAAHGMTACTPIVPVPLPGDDKDDDKNNTDKSKTTTSSSSSDDDRRAASTATGYGRVVQLSQATTLTALVQTLKQSLQLPTLRVASPPLWPADRPVRAVAVCAGSGSSVFRHLSRSPSSAPLQQQQQQTRTRVDVLVTGEMSHHDVLAAVAQEQAVVLCEHSNSERGYLRDVLARELQRRLGVRVRVRVAQSDHDPLVVW